MGIGRIKPARDQARAQDGDDILCDLDAVLSTRVTFIFQGKTHALLPITTERFFDFWKQVSDFQAIDKKTPDEVNRAFFKILSAVCETLTVSDVEAMTVVQKSGLLQHLVAKIVGNRSVLDGVEKKNPLIQTTQSA